jgi:fructan beta-fructosidase
MGWMSNWQYANKVPTSSWRSANTVPRELGIREVNKELYLTSTPVKELDVLNDKTTTLTNVAVNKEYDLGVKTGGNARTFKLTLAAPATDDFSVVLSNSKGNEVVIGYDKGENAYYVDRRKSGKTDFEKDFARRSTAPRLSTDKTLSLTLLVDVASVELFADNGLSVMTSVFFPEEDMSKLTLKSSSGATISKLTYTNLKSALPGKEKAE